VIEDFASASTPGPHPGTPRKRGRPLEMAPQEVLRWIRDLAERGQLFRVHHDAPALYARARRLYGTWAAALGAAGVNHGATVAAARQRALETRQQRRRACR
jgi:hypothetical protein